MTKTVQPVQAIQPVTDELRHWIVQQAEAGCRPHEVLAAMCASGWNEEVAIGAMEQVLNERLDEVAAGKRAQPTALGSAAAGAAAATGSKAAELAPAVPVPDVPYNETACPVLHVAGSTVRVLFTMAHPRIVVLGGLLSDEECDALMAQASARLVRSETVETKSGGSEVNAARTSDGMFFERGESEVITRVEQRIADLFKWPLINGEGLQILRYRPGAEYKPHHDYFDPVHSGTAKILERGGQRVGTLVMYLNTPEGGGATTFPDVGLSVAPIKGNAVFFSYERAHVTTKTLHGGAPVTAGEKWVATKWLREREFR
jgi:prolyl 4-hydroxylase